MGVGASPTSLLTAMSNLVLRFFGGDHDDRLLLVNLGRDVVMTVAPEPLLAPPPDRAWRVLWSSEDPRYGGSGIAPRSPPVGRPVTLARPAFPASSTSSDPTPLPVPLYQSRRQDRTGAGQSSRPHWRRDTATSNVH